MYGRFNRINNNRKNIGEEELTDKAIARTDRKIKSTDRRIDRLKEMIKQKEADRDERIRKLKERRSASRFDGGDTGGEPEIKRRNLGRSR